MEQAATVVQLMRQVERQPHYLTAVESASGAMSVGHLRVASNRLANALRGLGLEQGARVAYIAKNRPEYIVLEFALLKAGLVKVPLNYRLTAAELLRCLQIAEVQAVLADGDAAAVLDEVLSGADGPHRLILGERAGWRSFDDLLAGAADTDPKVPVRPDDYYHIRFSSGSTGTPKGIAISHRAARAAILGNTWVMSTSAPVLSPRTLQVAPLVYAGGWSVLPTLLRGGTNVIVSRFDADETLQAIHDRAIDWMFAVPTMLRRIADSPALPLLRSSRIGCLMLAGEPAALPALTVVSEHTDALVECWGQTEAPASTTILTRAEMRSPALWASIGRPIPGVEFSLLVDGEVLDRPDPDLDGELVIRSATVTSELLGAEAEHSARLLDDGWWRTSDRGRFDDEGRIFIVGRVSDTIITGGTNIQPVEIERALEEHPAVREAVVVGVPDERWGETPVALVFAPSLTTDRMGEVADWAAQRLAGFKRPRHVFVSSQPLPRLSGEAKIARGQLKATLTDWTRQPDLVPQHVTKVEEPHA
jgi:fatty-acyl-CoA synthase